MEMKQMAVLEERCNVLKYYEIQEACSTQP